MSKVYTLSEYIELYRNIDKITHIYLDTDGSLCEKLEANESRSIFDIIKESGLQNLLESDEYFEYGDEDYYIFNKYKLFENHKDDVVRRYCPVLSGDEESMSKLEEIENKYEDGIISSDEYIEAISKISEYCVLILSSKDILKQPESAFFPNFDSNINCVVLMNVEMDEDENNPGIKSDTLIGVIPDRSNLKQILKKRCGYHTAIYEIEKGHPLDDRSELYYTDLDGNVILVGTFSVDYNNKQGE